jgi:cation:H+ antiporter
VSEFLLVQWVAPLASEAPELLVAGLYAWRLNSNAGLGTLVSSKVNQWTLLVGTLPIVFALASRGLHGLPVDPHQREELLLTASQSVFADATLISLSISIPEAIALFVCSGRSSCSVRWCRTSTRATSASASRSATWCSPRRSRARRAPRGTG